MNRVRTQPERETAVVATSAGAWIAALWLALGFALPAPGQLPQPARQAERAESSEKDLAAPTVEEVAARREEVGERIGKLKRLAAVAQPEEARTLAQRIERLEGVDRLLALQLGELRRAEEIEGDAGLQAEILASGLEARFDHPPPYSVAELDSVLDELEAAAASREVSEEARKESLRQVERARDQLTEREHRERMAREEAGEAAPEPEPLRLLALEVEAAREQLRLRRLELRDVERELEVQKAREEKLRSLAREIRGQLAPTQAELESILAASAERAQQLDGELAEARQQTEAAEERWSAAQEQIELVMEPGAGLVAQATARRLGLAAAESREELLQRRRLRAGELDELWRLRFRVLRDKVPKVDLQGAAAELAGKLESLSRERRLAEARLDERRLSLNVLRQRLAGPLPDPGERRWLEEQQQHLEAIVALYESEVADVDSSARLARRLRAEVEERSGRVDLRERLGILWEKVAGVWAVEITEVEGSPITVGKVVTALLLVLVGYLFSKLLSQRVGRLILPRFGLARGAAVAVQTLVYYALFAIFFLWALRLVNIPLTVFTVLGGVLAIGIGFGSQNIMNNFISGLIILAEHPIKVGDLIDVDGVFGQVERIGPRSSRIRAGDNTHVIVPNSAFLEKNVLNWTVSDDVIRTSVDVGVAYGSPVEKVAEGLRQAIAEEPDILEEPPPEVLFMDFGDNALAFRAYFWVRVARSLDRFRFQSRLRFRIDRIFREAGIVIAFPQRDVHLDSLSPLEIRLVGSPPEPQRS